MDVTVWAPGHGWPVVTGTEVKQGERDEGTPNIPMFRAMVLPCSNPEDIDRT